MNDTEQRRHEMAVVNRKARTLMAMCRIVGEHSAQLVEKQETMENQLMAEDVHVIITEMTDQVEIMTKSLIAISDR
ncbi:hypothetical protein [Endozoicomonas lisbonensis]|uniref:hypothetical protein n=1 Tax=Endozoicomonas lisbonensis TaxID=3120522 RepID=UPI0033918834